ncbi:MAG: hypothetical protein ABI610_07320, partial [Acidobacteriota bacterium]
MRRIAFLVFGALWLAASAVSAQDAVKDRIARQIRPLSAAGAPALRVIAGTPLTVHVGDDMSFQVYNSAVPGSGQIFPSSCATTADMGVFVDMAGVLYAPDFNNHPCGSATGSIGTYTAWTPVSLSAVTGTGTAADPFRVVVVADAGTTGLRLTMTVSYVNGENFFRESYVFTSSSGPLTFNVFTGADIYLASSDSGVPIFDATSSSPGGRSGSPCSSPSGYNILFIPLTPADRYAAREYSTVWFEIGAGSLSNTVTTGCQDNGAALQWSNRTASPTSPVSIQTATSFGTIPSIAQFRLDTVTANCGNLGQTLTVVVTGIGFQAGTTFSFGPGVTVNSTTIDSPTQATLSLTVAPDTASGFRNVVGNQSTEGLTATLTNGFQVGCGAGPTPTPTLAPSPTPTVPGVAANVPTL